MTPPAVVHPRTTLSRRQVAGWLALAGLAAPAAAAWAQPIQKAQKAGAALPPKTRLVEVWKDPHCGCCKDWIAHMAQHGFQLTVHDAGNAAARQRAGIPVALGSCHTALVAGYAIEGHVPAGDVIRLLQAKPDAIGLTVPGMPIGSPGMDGPAYGGRKDPFDVLLVLRDGRTQVFRRVA